MKQHFFFILILISTLVACQAQNKVDQQGDREVSPVSKKSPLLFEVFENPNSDYAKIALKYFNQLNDKERVAQMIVSTGGKLGKSQEKLTQLVYEGVIGGVIYLSNTLQDHKSQVLEIKESATSYKVPMWFAIDAEPSLLNRRIIGSSKMKATSELTSIGSAMAAAKSIDSLIKDLGFQWNYAPVVDLGSENAAIKNRSFSNEPSKVVTLASAYVNQTQEDGVVACVKHFPGHGRVTGDTHKQSVYIDGPFEEYKVYEDLLKQSSPLSLMVGHITIKNNEYQTDGLPASLSSRILKDLIRDKMGYQGIVVTDALNMMAAATKYKDAPIMASKAGADVILMPKDEKDTHRQILEAIHKDKVYQEQVYESVLRILKLKAWLGLIK